MGTTCFYSVKRPKGVIYVNAYSGMKIICGAMSQTILKRLDAMFSEAMHSLGQTTSCNHAPISLNSAPVTSRR